MDLLEANGGTPMRPSTRQMAVDLIATYVANNYIPPSKLEAFIATTIETFGQLEENPAAFAKPHIAPPANQDPAVPIDKSVTFDYLICLEDGKQIKMLKPHLRKLKLTVEQYIAKWRLPPDYPLCSPSHSLTMRKNCKVRWKRQAERRLMATSSPPPAPRPITPPPLAPPAPRAAPAPTARPAPRAAPLALDAPQPFEFDLPPRRPIPAKKAPPPTGRPKTALGAAMIAAITANPRAAEALPLAPKPNPPPPPAKPTAPAPEPFKASLAASSQRVVMRKRHDKTAATATVDVFVKKRRGQTGKPAPIAGRAHLFNGKSNGADQR